MKKFAAVLMCFFITVFFSGCTEPERPDYEMLSERMAQINEHYAFEYFDMFLYEGSYHVYFSLCSEDDVMLSMVLDENSNIDSVTVTAEKTKMTTDGERNAYKSFVTAVIESFAELSDKEKDELSENLSYENINYYFSDLYETYEAFRYNFVFSSNSQYINLYCEYVELMDDPTNLS